MHLELLCACSVAQSWPTLCDLMDGSPPGSSAMGVSRREYWSGLPYPLPKDLHLPCLLHCRLILYHRATMGVEGL